MAIDRIKVSVIGLRGHAGQHIAFLKNNSNVLLEKIYYYRDALPDYADLPITDSLSDCMSADVIIISTPTPSHIEYIRALSDYHGYIFLEKPAVNSADHILELHSLPTSLKQRTRVGFNFNFHPLAALFSDLIRTGQLGKVFSFDVHTSHGVAFRDDWGNTWRVDNETGLGPLETTGIHYIQFSIKEFGDCIGRNLHTECLSGRPGAIDTGFITLTMEDGTLVRIRHSYAAPYAVRFELWGTEGYLVYDGEVANLFHPRNTFDEHGRFTNPPLKASWEIKFQQGWFESLEKTQKDFLEIAQKGVLLDPLDFDRDVSAMEILLRGRSDQSVQAP